MWLFDEAGTINQVDDGTVSSVFKLMIGTEEDAVLKVVVDAIAVLDVLEVAAVGIVVMLLKKITRFIY